jgi:hypothetical protein
MIDKVSSVDVATSTRHSTASLHDFRGCMRYLNVIGLLGVLIAMSVASAAAVESPSSSLIVTSLDDSIELSVPVSRLTLTFPRGGLATINEPGTGATASGRYFHFYDQKPGLVVSGWFEPASSYGGFEKFWTGELLAMKKNGIPIREIPEVLDAGPWQAVAYNVDLENGVSANVRAELISAGTWVDVHISVTSKGPPREAREQALQFLRSVVAKEK